MKTFIGKKLKHWYLLLIAGILFILLGILAFVNPGVTFLSLSIMFSFGFLLSGAAEMYYAIANRAHMNNWGWYLALGIITFMLGLQLVANPGLSMLLLSMYIGLWVMFRSVMAISSAIELKQHQQSNWFWVLIWAILGIVFSFFLLTNPVITGMTVSIWMGMALIALGLFYITLSFSLKRMKNYVNDVKEKLENYRDQNSPQA